MKFNLDFNIAMGKWVLFSILIFVILYGSYYSLFGLREGFAPGTCPKGCWQHPEGDIDGNCTQYNVEDGYNSFKITDEQGTTNSSVQITPGVYQLDTLAVEMQRAIRAASKFTKFTCTAHDPKYEKPGKKSVDHYLNQLEFNLNEDADTLTLTIEFYADKKYAPHESPLASLFKTEKLVLNGSKPVYTPVDLKPWFPYNLKDFNPSSACRQICTWGGYEGGITKDKDYCQYDNDCNACPTTDCPGGVCPPVKKKNPYPPPPPSPSKKGRGGGGGGGGDDGGGDGGGDGGDDTDVLDCKKAKCYEQPDAGSNKQFNRYKEDVGFCGIDYTDKSGKKFMFGCSSSETCAELDCNTNCARDPKTKKFVGKCKPYPKPDSQGGGGGGDGGGDEEDRGDNNSSNNYYDNDMDDYMNELMKPGQMTPNQMYNFREARYGCDSSKFGCCADGFTFKKDATGKNCFDFLPYYNPILFRGGA
jgi:hypothetical protein